MIDLKSLSIGNPILYKGDAFALLKEIPDGTIDVILTSPPYFNQRAITEGPFHGAANMATYLRLLKRLGKEFKRILKPTLYGLTSEMLIKTNPCFLSLVESQSLSKMN